MTNALDRISNPPAPAPSHLGQATAIEQSRAAAEVAAAVHVAQANPRDMQKALTEMRESCRQVRLAERAFFRYSRGGNNVTGATVHLARELARCFGNVQYGIAELRRDDAGGYSEMQAYAWDVERNTRSAQIFVVPHVRDTKKGPQQLTDLRDVYENNANMGARRLRAAIWAILPPWFVDEAEEICNQTLTDGGGVPLSKRVADWVAAFGRQGITQTQLEQKIGRPSRSWTEHDVAQLSVIGKSVARGETRIEDEFPPERVTVADITGAAVEHATPAEPAPFVPATVEGIDAAEALSRIEHAVDQDGLDRIKEMCLASGLRDPEVLAAWTSRSEQFASLVSHSYELWPPVAEPQNGGQ